MMAFCPEPPKRDDDKPPPFYMRSPPPPPPLEAHKNSIFSLAISVLEYSITQSEVLCHVPGVMFQYSAI